MNVNRSIINYTCAFRRNQAATVGLQTQNSYNTTYVMEKCSKSRGRDSKPYKNCYYKTRGKYYT